MYGYPQRGVTAITTAELEAKLYGDGPVSDF